MNDAKRRALVAVARDVFARHGYRRVNMQEIAAAAGVSRPGLYLYFKTKEDIFSAAVLSLAESSIARIVAGLPQQTTTEEKLRFAFEIWTVEIFDLTLTSPEAKELSELSYDFAREALDEGYRQFEAVLASILKAHAKHSTTKLPLPADRMAHLLGSAARGFKLVAQSSTQLRKMIHDLLKVLLTD
jgi:TetR/AcrR family transcriptional regulator, regulator of autoinduction and epiphytic fitness